MKIWKLAAICAVQIILVCNLWAADTNSDKYDEYKEPVTVGEIVVTATRWESLKQDIAANITVITKEDIEKMPVSSAAEVLQYIPGIYVEFNGGPGSVANVRIQGSEIRHVAVFQDGVPLNQLANPQTDISYLPIDAIERIEIYKGAASSSWGSSLGGVINIITKDPDREKPFKADARTSYGEHRTSKSRGSVSGTLERFSYLLSLTHDESKGFIEHTEYNQDAVYAKVNYNLSEMSCLNFVFSHDEGDNADPLLNYPDFWDDIHRRRTYERLLFETSPADNLYLTLEGRHHRFYSKIDDVYQDRRELYSDYNDEIWGAGVKMKWDIVDSNTLNLGFDGDWGSYDWINYTKEYKTGNWATYINDTLSMGDFSLNAGLRYDHNDDFGSEVSPSAGVVYRLFGGKVLVRTQIARGFSAPPASWVHDPELGNPELEPEIARNYQIGCEIQPLKPLQLKLNLFRADVKNLIRFNSITRKYENIDKVTREGVEGEIRANFDFGLALSFGGSYVDVRDDNTDQVIEDIPRKQFNASSIYTYKWMTHSIVGRYIDHNSSYTETHDRVFIFDYLLKVKLPFLKTYGKPTLFGAIYNIFDTNYLYREVWPQPDRWVEGGVSFEF
jgi:vitamin B12 transporter